MTGRGGHNEPSTRSEHPISTASRTSTVEATPGEIWSTLADFDRIVDWAPSVDHSEAMTEPPPGPGAARRVQVGRLTLVETVITWEPPSTLAYRLEGLPPFVARAVNRWTLESAGPDRTTVTVTLDLTPGPRPPMRAAVAILARVLGRANARMLAGLADHLERTTP